MPKPECADCGRLFVKLILCNFGLAQVSSVEIEFGKILLLKGRSAEAEPVNLYADLSGVRRFDYYTDHETEHTPRDESRETRRAIGSRREHAHILGGYTR